MTVGDEMNYIRIVSVEGHYADIFLAVKFDQSMPDGSSTYVQNSRPLFAVEKHIDKNTNVILSRSFYWPIQFLQKTENLFRPTHSPTHSLCIFPLLFTTKSSSMTDFQDELRPEFRLQLDSCITDRRELAHDHVRHAQAQAQTAAA